MKFLKVAVMAAVALAWSSAYAFHSGGVAECEGCHTMHNSHNGEEMGSTAGTGPYLLVGTDQSSACLTCHAAADAAPSSYHIATLGINPYDATTPVESTPGGDFAWLKKTMNLTIRNKVAADGNLGASHGHNVVAGDFGYVVDPRLTKAPGGDYPAASLHCSSCHDPHGRTRRLADGTYALTGLPIRNSGSYNNSLDPIANIYAVGAYRILAGTGYEPKSTTGYPFTAQVPDAVAPSTYNRAETSLTSQTVVAYGQGMSEWCGNCHGGFVQSGYTSGDMGLKHPAGNDSVLTTAVAGNYNTYISSGRTGAAGDRFSTLTPFEIGTNNYTTLKGFSSNGAPATGVSRLATTSNNVACVSCHRAHASGFGSMLRFFYLNEFSTIGDDAGVAAYDSNATENKINYGYSVAQQEAAYNFRPASVFGPYARKSCNKCHMKD